jgi:flagellar basal-body rod modification protein FlgD
MTTVNAIAPVTATGATTTGSASKEEIGSADRFLKLLVTQMQNQDPLNPMDNAQVTSQMAQINTVSGIEKLNETVKSLQSSFSQMQTLQGAALVGRTVTLSGNKVALDGTRGQGGVELGSTADRVKVEILSPAGRVVDTLELGTLEAGRHGFEWDASKAPALAPGQSYSFKVSASLANTAIASQPLMRDRIESVTSGPGGLVLNTERSGGIAQGDVLAFN